MVKKEAMGPGFWHVGKRKIFKWVGWGNFCKKVFMGLKEMKGVLYPQKKNFAQYPKINPQKKRPFFHRAPKQRDPKSSF